MPTSADEDRVVTFRECLCLLRLPSVGEYGRPVTDGDIHARREAQDIHDDDGVTDGCEDFDTCRSPLYANTVSGLVVVAYGS